MFTSIFFIFAGIFAALGGIMDWDWFMNHRRAAFFVRLFGRFGARAFYVILGLAIAIGGALMATGIIGPEAA